MIDRALMLEQFDQVVVQLKVARAFLLDDGGPERLMHARDILTSVGRAVAEIIDLEIDPALGWRPGHRLDIAPALPGASERGARAVPVK